LTIKERLAQDLKTAMRDGDRVKVSVLRLLGSLIKNREVAKRTELAKAAAGKGSPLGKAELEAQSQLGDAEVIQAITSACKQRRESAELYREGHREDLASAEEAELKILESYLPQALTPEELRARVNEAIRATGAASPKEMGKVMAALMPHVQGRADGKVVSEMVREALGKG
jgi:uncharacterized protein YqeY